ncbi:MAG: DUF1501 domain-containing protein [Myxococcaceae bacterium]
MRNTSRRQLLKWSLGASQLALLERFNLLGASRAHAQTMDAPTRLVVLYVPGGFRPHYAFWPGTDAQVEQNVPDPGGFAGEPTFFRASDLMDLAPGDGRFPALRVWRSWNPAMPQQRHGTPYTPSMYGYVNWALHENVAIAHGIDQGTADHASAFVSAMCGVPSPDFRAPALHSVVANHFFAQTKEQRPLPFVTITSERGLPQATGLPSHAAPVRVPSIEALKPQLSTKPADNPWWAGLEARTAKPELNFDGSATGSMIQTTPLEDYTLGIPGAFKGKSSVKTDGFLEQLHGSLRSVSRVLAADVVTVLERTKGIDALTASRPAYLSGYLNSAFSYTFGLANFHMTGLEPRFDMALRLLKADLATAVHVSMGLDFDTHSGLGHGFSCAHGRNMFDLVARFLGELKSTPLPNKPGKTLLDDTLVVMMSEFGRSWATKSATGYNLPDDHHPFTSVMFAGGNVANNRMVGTYDGRGFGMPTDIIEENEQPSRRVPRAADVTTTALRIMGLGFHDFFIPGGFGEIVGLRKNA